MRLFIVTRYRENLRRDASVEDSVVASIDTSGRAVLFAGITVISTRLLGLLLIGLAFVQGVAIASALAVAMMIAASSPCCRRCSVGSALASTTPHGPH